MRLLHLNRSSQRPQHGDALVLCTDGLHGYVEDETPSVTPETAAKKVRAEELTSEKMAQCFDVLSDDERQDLADGTLAMFAALKEPVTVS